MTSSKKAATLNLQTISTVTVICPKPYEKQRFTQSRLNKNKNKESVAEKAAREEELIQQGHGGRTVSEVGLALATARINFGPHFCDLSSCKL